jgi:hypothetical protein
MRRSFRHAVLTISMMLNASSALTASDVSGTWDLQMRFPPNLTSTGTCVLRQERDMLTGTCGGDADRFRITRGEVIGNQVSWQIEVTQGGAAGLMRFAGELDREETTINGALSIDGGADGTFTMKKRHAAAEAADGEEVTAPGTSARDV